MNLKIDKAVRHLVENGGSLGGAMEAAGYSKNTAKTPKKMTEQKEFKEKIAPIATRWEREIARIQSELELKDLSGEKYKDLVDSLDKLNKNLQLLTGGATENVVVTGIEYIVPNENNLNTNAETTPSIPSTRES